MPPVPAPARPGAPPAGRPLALVVIFVLAGGLAGDTLLAEDADADSAGALLLAGLVAAQCAVLWASDRWLDRRGRRLAPVAEVIGGTLLAGSVYAVVVAIAAGFVGAPQGPWAVFSGAIVEGLLIVSLWIVSVRYPALRLRALEAERLQAAAEMADLRARLQPHFLMNSLNAIAARVGDDPDRARRLIADLAELLRAAIHADPHERTIGEELAWLRRYGALLEARYDGDLVLAWHVDDAAAAARIPPLLIQPLVENAILHGGDAPPPRRVDVSAALAAGGRLRLVIASDGVAAGADAAGTGSGLELVRRRLALWRPGATLSLEQRDGRTVATIDAPAAHGG